MYRNVDMSAYSSMKTGGVAEKCFFPESVEEFCDNIRQLQENNEKYYILGNMSNVLIPDGVLKFVPVVTTKLKYYFVKETDDAVLCRAECGVSLTMLAYEMSKKGYSGLEFAYGIPGSIGGAVFMNAGAYGSEVKNVICEVETLEIKTGKKVSFTCEECKFGYRTSIFQNGEYAVLGATFKLTKADFSECLKNAKEIMQKRIDKQPLEYPSCGSTFKRPEGFFAGKLIQDSGLMGCSIGGAQVSEKHAGFVINRNDATTDDILKLMRYVRKTVYEKFGVTLEEEIKLLDENGEIFKL